MRNYTPTELPKLNRIDGPNGRRYETPNGDLYPSVTTIFSAQENSFLDQWKARVGEEEAARISRHAALRGTFIHEQAEHWLKGTPRTPSSINNMLYGDAWRSFIPVVDKIGDVFALEAPLYSDYLKVAGTVDCVGMWEGRRSIIDFKTSSRFKSADDIPNYWMQCAAYACMWEERTGQPINQLVILMSVDNESPLVYTDRRDNWIRPFMKLRKEYATKIGE